jgi:hypothetical protein
MKLIKKKAKALLKRGEAPYGWLKQMEIRTIIS